MRSIEKAEFRRRNEHSGRNSRQLLQIIHPHPHRIPATRTHGCARDDTVYAEYCRDVKCVDRCGLDAQYVRQLLMSFQRRRGVHILGPEGWDGDEGGGADNNSETRVSVLRT